jgi:hypothetical protein
MEPAAVPGVTGCLCGDTMSSGNVDLSSILNRILDTAADNLRVAKILVLLGLDPNNVTYDAIFNRLLEIVLAQITLANMCALIGSAFFVATLLMRTMMPLRISNIISNVFFIAFGALGADIKTFLMYLLLLPINGVRLYQMRKLVKMARNATKGDKSMEWLKPFMTERKYRKGDKLCSKGDAANEMFLTISGKFLVTEFNIELPPGSLMGELGFLTRFTAIKYGAPWLYAAFNSERTIAPGLPSIDDLKTTYPVRSIDADTYFLAYRSPPPESAGPGSIYWVTGAGQKIETSG